MDMSKITYQAAKLADQVKLQTQKILGKTDTKVTDLGRGTITPQKATNSPIKASLGAVKPKSFNEVKSNLEKNIYGKNYIDRKNTKFSGMQQFRIYKLANSMGSDRFEQIAMKAPELLVKNPKLFLSLQKYSFNPSLTQIQDALNTTKGTKNFTPVQASMIQQLVDKGWGISVINEFSQPSSENVTLRLETMLKAVDLEERAASFSPFENFNSLKVQLTPQEQAALSKLQETIPDSTLFQHIAKDGVLNTRMLRAYINIGQDLSSRRQSDMFSGVDTNAHLVGKSSGILGFPSYSISNDGQINIKQEFIGQGSFKKVNYNLNLNSNTRNVVSAVKDYADEAITEASIYDSFSNLPGSKIFSPYAHSAQQDYAGKLLLYGTAYDGDGTSLKGALISQKINVAADVSLGLSQMHSRGFIHNDFKSDNLLFLGDPKDPTKPVTAYVSDLGGAKKEGERVEVHTLAFSPPERMADNPEKFKLSNPQSDSWALGATIACILSEDEHPLLELQSKFESIRLNPNIPDYDKPRHFKNAQESMLKANENKALKLAQTPEDRAKIKESFTLCRELMNINASDRISTAVAATRFNALRETPVRAAATPTTSPTANSAIDRLLDSRRSFIPTANNMPPEGGGNKENSWSLGIQFYLNHLNDSEAFMAVREFNDAADNLPAEGKREQLQILGEALHKRLEEIALKKDDSKSTKQILNICKNLTHTDPAKRMPIETAMKMLERLKT